MTNPPSQLLPDDVRTQLQRLRQGPALGHPGVVRALSSGLRDRLLARQRPLNPPDSEVSRLVAALRQVIDGLSPLERRYAATDFNLLPEHSWPTLSERQESLARVLGCSAKTVRRHSSQALDTLALLILEGSYLPVPESPSPAARTGMSASGPGLFFGITDVSRVDVLCSDLPIEQPGSYRQPNDPLYSRYRLFADLDALFYVRVRLAQMFPAATVRDFHPGEYYSADADALIVLGAPHRNARYADFLPHLPYRFGPHPDGGLAFPEHTSARFGPSWTAEGELLSDLTVITRITLAEGTTVTLVRK